MSDTFRNGNGRKNGMCSSTHGGKKKKPFCCDVVLVTLIKFLTKQQLWLLLCLSRRYNNRDYQACTVLSIVPWMCCSWGCCYLKSTFERTSNIRGSVQRLFPTRTCCQPPISTCQCSCRFVFYRLDSQQEPAHTDLSAPIG